MKGTKSSSTPSRPLTSSGAPKSHQVATGKPAIEAGTNAAKSGTMSQHPGAFKSTPGKGNSA